MTATEFWDRDTNQVKSKGKLPNDSSIYPILGRTLTGTCKNEQ